jgi:hypothetical protein
MRRFSTLQKVLLLLVALASLLVITTSGLVLYARHAIQRGARWQGVSLQNEGLALVFMCEPQSGIRRAFFFVRPWARVELEKLNLHDPP